MVDKLAKCPEVGGGYAELFCQGRFVPLEHAVPQIKKEFAVDVGVEDFMSGDA